MKKITPIKISFLIVFLLFVTSLFAQTTLDIPSNNSNTGEEDVNGGTPGDVSLSSSDLEFYYDGSTEQKVAVRFSSVAVPKNATITNAYIQFKADQSDGGSVVVDIVGDAVANSLALDTNDDYNFTNRTPTSTSVEWDIASWTAGNSSANERTSDISSIISEITSLDGWSSGNAMTFIFTGVSRSGGNIREAESGSSDTAPVLHVEYVEVPEIDIIGNGISITNGDNTPDVSDGTEYGSVGISQSLDRTFTVINEGSGTINITGIALTGDSEFSFVSPPSTPIALLGGESISILIRFTPSSVTTFNGQVSITNDDLDENPYTFDIQGNGATPMVDIEVLGNGNEITHGDNTPSLSDDTDFGSIYSFVERTRTFTINNDGNSDLTVSSVTSSNPDFTITNQPSATVLIGESTTFDVTFSPSSIAMISSTITITSNDPDENPFTFVVQGTSTTSPAFASTVSSGDSWYYLSDGSNQGTNWRELSFDQEEFIGPVPTEIGYGDGDEATDIGQPATPRPFTTYFRKYINIADASIFNSIDLEAVRDDGIVVYLNGTEIWRNNMPTTGEILFNTPASSPAISGAAEDVWNTKSVSSSALVDGVNILAVEIHQNEETSSDISFNFRFNPSATVLPPPTVERGPYLNSGTPTSVVVRWRTDNSTQSVVNYGTSLGALSSTESILGLTTEHEVTLTGLTPNTKYYYEIADNDGVLISESSEMYVVTAPVPNTNQFVRAWILGDAGTANQDQRDVRDAYYNYVSNAGNNPNQTDMMLFLGDNAYNDGTDSQYQAAFYDVYDDMLKKAVAWSTLGNHDGYSSGSSANPGIQSGPYYDMFTFPTGGEAGGLASGTEAYYSFDYANIHFIVLESYHLENDATQLSWLTSDLAATTQDWIVAFFHHPAYTKGSHDSDSEGDLIDVRNNFLPILEAGGVDLVLSGHSHSYERSFFINGHYGLSGTFDGGSGGSHIVGANGHLSGKADTADGAYIKAFDPEGAVYITTGSAGKVTGTLTTHNAMFSAIHELGSCVMEIADDGSGGQNLTVKFVRETGTIDDYFTINKSSTVLSSKSQVIEDENLLIYPVPTNELLNIKVVNGEKLQTIQFYNVVGSMVKESTKEQINVSGLKSGVYMLRIKTDKNTYFKSIIID